MVIIKDHGDTGYDDDDIIMLMIIMMMTAMFAMITVIYPPRATMLSSRSSSGLRLAVDLSLGWVLFRNWTQMPLTQFWLRKAVKNAFR